MPFDPPIVPLPEIPPQPPVAVPDAAADPHAFNAWLAAWQNYRWCVQQHACAAQRAVVAEFSASLVDAIDAAAGAVMQALAKRARPAASDVFLMLADKWGFRPSDTDANWPKQIEPMVAQIMAALERVDPPQSP